MEKNRAVLYLRLSKEDKNKQNAEDVSDSIMNQKLLLCEYAAQHGFRVCDIYADEDESGLYEERTSFKKMLEDAKTGKYDIILAKSQSRFSRNMEHIEKYLHRELPALGIRFIGVADHADSLNRGNKKSRQINAMVNEWYCEDLSENIKSVFRAKMIDGQYIGAFSPYGYKKSVEDHHRLEVDPCAAKVVQKIYALYLGGMGKQRIAVELTKAEIENPSIYKTAILGENYYNPAQRKQAGWSSQTIHYILNNPVYKGDLVQSRYRKISYKGKKRIQNPKEEWIIIKNNHEPVIQPEVYALVQALQKTKAHTFDSKNKGGIFQGLLFCADCGRPMAKYYKKSSRYPESFQGYFCKTYKTMGKQFCSQHKISNEKITQIIAGDIKKQLKNRLTETKQKELLQYGAQIEKGMQERETEDDLEIRIKKNNEYKRKCLEKYLDGYISKEEYDIYKTEYTIKNKKLEEKKEARKKKKEIFDTSYQVKWREALTDKTELIVDRYLLLSLVKRIEIHEDGQISITYRFEGMGT